MQSEIVFCFAWACINFFCCFYSLLFSNDFTISIFCFIFSIFKKILVPGSSSLGLEMIFFLLCLIFPLNTEGHHIISRIETHLSDGTTQVSTTLTPETAQLLSKLHPGLFPEGTLLQVCDSVVSYYHC